MFGLMLAVGTHGLSRQNSPHVATDAVGAFTSPLPRRLGL